jgi:formylglycine-generating enzyme required for sulfatase activity
MKSVDLPSPDMVLLEGGSFVMGSASGQGDEAPPHLVELSRLYIARFAVINREYSIYLQQTGAQPPPSWNDPKFNHPDQPVVAVSWHEAADYCAWLGKVLNQPYRLPTEAERECACRGGTATAYPWGDSAERDCGEYGRRWLEGGPEIVGGPPNGFGLCNMADNVHEWCSDWYGRDYYTLSPPKDPQGPESGVRRTSRGGSWRHHVKVTRSSARSAIDPCFRYADYGFRIARSG